MKKKLSGKVALITGAARGIGRDYALRLAQLGADVGVIDIDMRAHLEFAGEKLAEEFDTVIDELHAIGVRAIGVEADITDEIAVNQAIDKITNELGEVDILIANAGGGIGEITENRASEINIDHLKIVMNRNFYGTVYSVKGVIESMKRRKTGKIITVSSVTGLRANHLSGAYAHYAAAKATIVSYTKNLAQDVGAYNITANVIAPGYIATGRLSEQFEKTGAKTLREEVALQRFGTPKDCANVMEFLATDLSDYVTGTVIDVTGGLLLE